MTNSEVSQGTRPKCVFVNTYYPQFLDTLYSENPGLSDRSYDEQKATIQAQFFGDSDFYSAGLIGAGWQAEDLIVNCVPLQRAWAQENDFQSLGMGIAVEQIRRVEPDVVYLQDLSLATNAFLEQTRESAELIVGQIACALPTGIEFRGFDLIFSSFPHYVERFRAQGITAYYQPLAFDPRVLERMDMQGPKHCATFVGGLLTHAHGGRIELVERLASRTPIELWGYGTNALSLGSPAWTRHHGEAWGLEMFSILGRSLMTVNMHGEVSESYANCMRLFEATGCGTLLITDYKDNLNELFAIGEEVVAFRSAEEAAGLVNYYLAHPDEAQAIAAAGQRRTQRDHTYAIRMEQTAEILERHLRSRAEANRFASPDLSAISRGHTPIDRSEITTAMTSAWQSPEMPDKQRALVSQELASMYRGDAPGVYHVLADAIQPFATPGCSVLEIGCASGYYYEILEYLLGKKFDYTGVDYSEHLISMARDFYPRAKFEVADGAQLPFDHAFDIAISSGVLLHTPNFTEHIAETARVTGSAAIAHRTPICRARPTQYLKKFAYGVETVELRFNEAEFLAEFLKNGLRLVRAIEYSSSPGDDSYDVTYVFIREAQRPDEEK